MVQSSDLHITRESGDLHKIEKARIRFVRLSRFGSPLVKFLCVVCVLTSFLPFVGFITLLAAVVLVLVQIFAISLPQRKFRKSFKAAMGEKIVSQASPTLTYYPEKGFEENYFYQANLFKNSSTWSFRSEDLVAGSHGETLLKFAEVDLINTSENDSIIGSPEDISMIFFVADFHKHFKGETYVLPKKSFGKKMNPFKVEINPGLPKVKLENTEFHQQFEVQSTDEIEARYILSLSMLERISTLNHQHGGGMRLAFKDTCIWIALPLQGEFFEPNEKVSVHDERQGDSMVEEIRTYLALVDELNLNTRIWSKA